MCLCEQLVKEQKLTIIDIGLTSETASLKGYKYVEDIPNIYATLLDLIEFAEIQGYKIGKPKTGKKHFGLYLKKLS